MRRVCICSLFSLVRLIVDHHHPRILCKWVTTSPEDSKPIPPIEQQANPVGPIRFQEMPTPSPLSQVHNLQLHLHNLHWRCLMKRLCGSLRFFFTLLLNYLFKQNLKSSPLSQKFSLLCGYVYFSWPFFCISYMFMSFGLMNKWVTFSVQVGFFAWCDICLTFCLCTSFVLS